MPSPTDPQVPTTPDGSVDSPPAAPAARRGVSIVAQQAGIAAALMGTVTALATLRLGAGGPEAAALQPVLGALLLGGAALGTAGVALLGRRRSQSIALAADHVRPRGNITADTTGDAAVDQLMERVRERAHADEQRVVAVEAKARSLSRRIDELEAEIDGQVLSRRERVAAVSGRITVALAVAGRPMPARLVDLSPASVVLDIRAAEQPDLAPGMLARIGIAARGMSEPSLFDVRCESARGMGEDSVRMRLIFDQSIGPEDVPAQLQDLVNQRRSPRVRPRPEVGLTAAVRRHAEARPISAAVADLSDTGVRLLLPIEQDRFSAWGTRLLVAIALGPGDKVVYFAGRVRNVHADGEGHVIVGLEFDPAATSDFAARQQALSEWIYEELGHQREAAGQAGAAAAAPA